MPIADTYNYFNSPEDIIRRAYIFSNKDYGLPGGRNVSRGTLPSLPNLPKIDLPSIQGPNIDLKGPNIDLKGPNFQGPALQWPNVKGPSLNLPAVNLPNINLPNMPQVPLPPLNLPQVDFSKLGIRLPELNLPKLNLPQVPLPSTGGLGYSNGQITYQPTIEQGLNTAKDIAGIAGQKGLETVLGQAGSLVGNILPFLPTIELLGKFGKGLLSGKMYDDPGPWANISKENAQDLFRNMITEMQISKDPNYKNTPAFLTRSSADLFYALDEKTRKEIIDYKRKLLEPTQTGPSGHTKINYSQSQWDVMTPEQRAVAAGQTQGKFRIIKGE